MKLSSPGRSLAMSALALVALLAGGLWVRERAAIAGLPAAPVAAFDDQQIPEAS